MSTAANDADRMNALAAAFDRGAKLLDREPFDVPAALTTIRAAMRSAAGPMEIPAWLYQWLRTAETEGPPAEALANDCRILQAECSAAAVRLRAALT